MTDPDDADLSRYQDFACEYQHEQSKWGITVRATSFEDARKRLRAMGTTGQVLGNNVIEVPALPGVGLFVRAWCAVGNLLRGRP